MKNETINAPEAQLLDLLKQVLPKATHDPKLAQKIYHAVELEFKAKARLKAFEKFCAKVELPDLEPTERRLALWAHPLWAGFLVLLMGVFWAGRKAAGAF